MSIRCFEKEKQDHKFVHLDKQKKTKIYESNRQGLLGAASRTKSVMSCKSRVARLLQPIVHESHARRYDVLIFAANRRKGYNKREMRDAALDVGVLAVRSRERFCPELPPNDPKPPN